jgi:peptide chain release factor 1
MLEKIQLIREQYIRLEERLSDPEVTSDMAVFTKTSKQYKDLQTILEVGTRFENVMAGIADAKLGLSDSDDEMRAMAREELNILEPQVEDLEAKIRFLLIPRDPEDSRDVIFEIRSGTGGDEASLFVGDLLRMYSRYFDAHGFKAESVTENAGTAGGFKEVILEVSGTEVYGHLKYESGVHRVQRVPETEAKGRVHTSAATVAVIPKYDEEDVIIRPDELKIDVFRASGAGGQHVNRTESAVRITHLPTGIVCECQEGRSQIKNREIAMGRLYQKIIDQQRAASESEQAERRRNLIGSGDRSEKIRTYNWPQNRVTDHRLEGDYKNYNLDRVVTGEIEEIIDQLRLAYYSDALAQQE